MSSAVPKPSLEWPDRRIGADRVFATKAAASHSYRQRSLLLAMFVHAGAAHLCWLGRNRRLAKDAYLCAQWRRRAVDWRSAMGFKTILVPIEQHDLTNSILETALLLAQNGRHWDVTS